MSALHPRSHSRSQPMSARPDLQPQAVRNILKNVESHVRLMSQLENISVSSSYSALRLRGPAPATTASSSSVAPGTDSAANEAGYSQCAQSQPSSETSSSHPTTTASASGSSTWSEPYNVTRVHRGTPIQQFYDEVVAPCVANSLSGQSYVFLVNGPPESGRSQTLYGSPHQSESGLVELTAADLIARMLMRQRMLEKQEATQSAQDGGVATTTDKSVPMTATATSGESAGGITVTYSAFITRGTHATETVSGEPVKFEAFPPPLGNVPLPHMRLLDPSRPASAAVLIPDSKHVDTSCLVQFHVYAPVDGSGKRTMATLTFVDVAAFRVPLCREVVHLAETVRRIAGVAPEGGDPRFQDYCLTQVLESALVGYVTLVNITTISGRQDLYPSSCAALQFASDIHRIHQVLMLIHIQAPKWLFETARSLEQLRQEREQMLSEDYAAGVRDYYHTVSTWLSKHVGDVGPDLDRLAQETAKIRTDIAQEVDGQSKALEEQLALARSAGEGASRDAKAAHAASAAQLDTLHRLDEAISDLEKTASQSSLQSGHRISEIRLQISSLEATNHNRQMELESLKKEEDLYTGKTREVLSVLDKYAEDMCYAQFALSSYVELYALTDKRRRLESDLELASQLAHRQTRRYQKDRERRSQLSRLTILQQRVDSLRASASAAVLPVRAGQSDSRTRAGVSVTRTASGLDEKENRRVQTSVTAVTAGVKRHSSARSGQATRGGGGRGLASPSYDREETQ